MIDLAIASIRARRLPVALVMTALTAAMVLLLSIERIQTATQDGFNQSLSGVDLIIGPRSGGIELVLYTAFHLGRPTNNITTETVNDIAQRPEIDWLVPIALGDNHRGFRVVATTADYFEHIKYAGNRPLTFQSGRRFSQINEVVVGSAVADQLAYSLDSKIYITHGASASMGQLHDDFAFTVVGILEPTGTPNDHAVFVDLKGYELIHLGWQSGTRAFSIQGLDLETIPEERLEPKTVTAAYVGLKSKLGLFQFMRDIQAYSEEAVSAIIPGLALAELWSIVGMVDNVFEFLSWMIIAISLIAMVTMTITSLDSRTREMTILRATGASPWHLSALVMMESLVLGVGSIVASVVLVTATTWLAQDYLTSALGISPEISFLSLHELGTFGIILLAGLASSLLPAMMVFWRSLQQGLIR
jgi:putative ABC transport system permease protein